jgi:mannosyltransferase
MRLTERRPQRLVTGLLIGLLLLSLGLRLYRIEAQSLWNDEGTAVALARRDLAAITRAAANDIHPPLYYYLLHYWMAVFGDSELAVRALSAWLGTLVVLLTFLWARTVAGSFASPDTGNSVGLAAAFFAALSPFQIYYSQETRMYILATLLGALSMYAFVHLLARWQAIPAGAETFGSAVGRYLTPAVYLLASALLLYSHYFAVTILVAQNVAWLWWLKKRRLRFALGWVALQIVVVAAYLPWLLLAQRQLRAWPAISEPLQLTTLVFDVLRVFSLGLSADALPDLVLAGFALLLILGMLRLCSAAGDQAQTDGTRSARSTLCVTSLLYLFVPIGAIYALSLQRPMYNPKFLLLATPAFHLFLAQGALSVCDKLGSPWKTMGTQTRHYLAWLPFAFTAAAIAFVGISSLLTVHAYYFDPRYARDDYRGIAGYIQAVEKQRDAVLINAPGQIETFTYYYSGDLSLYPLPQQRPLDEAQTEANLREMITGRERVFAVLWATDESDPGRFVEGWLDRNTYKATDSWYGNVRLVVYGVPSQTAGVGIDHRLDINLGNKVRLLGYNLLTPEMRPGDILQLTLFWQAIAPMNERYKVFTHVVDSHGHLVGQRDAEPGGGAKITTIWEEGEQVVDNYGLPILPATPPGDYLIDIGMYGLEDGARLPVIEGDQTVADHVTLQLVRVLPALAPPPLSVLGMREQLSTRFGDVTLLGYDLSKLGHQHEPDAPLHAGDILHLTLFWQANRQPVEGMEVTLRLKDEKGSIWLERSVQPTEGHYPADKWGAQEIIRDQHNLVLPADLPIGRYRIDLTVRLLPGGQPTGPMLILTTLAIK